MSLKRNVLANYLGQGWTALMGIAFVPVYIRYLGMEAYGLIGVFAMLQAWLTLLDMGMTPTLNREMARFAAGARSAQSIRDLLRTMEVICISIAILIGLGVWLASGWLANSWLQAEALPPQQIQLAISIIGLVVALRFIESLYRGAVLGLQKQVWLSAVSSGFATLRWGGAVCILIWVAPTIEAFFIWQALVSLTTILTIAVAVNRLLPAPTRTAQFSMIQLRGIWRFAGGMMVTTLLAVLLTQVDKAILSRVLSLEMFGYYTFAGMIAAVLYQVTGPITQAYFPRFTELVAQGDSAKLKDTYHQGAQLVSVTLIPAALMLALFGHQLLVLWTQDQALAANTAPLLALLAIGTLLNGLMHIPQMLTLANGWAGFAMRMNMVAVAVLVPAIIVVTPRYGALGAATIWIVLNAGYVLLGMHYLHRHLLKDEKWHWYLRDVLLPAGIALSVASACWWAQPELMHSAANWAWLVTSGLLVVLAAVLAAPGTRALLLAFTRRSLQHV